MDLNLSGLNNLLDNKNVTAVLSLVLALYAGLAAPVLPNSVIQFFDTMVGKVLFIFLIAYVASRNFQVAIMLALAFVVTLNIANKRLAESFMAEEEEAFMNQEEPYMGEEEGFAGHSEEEAEEEGPESFAGHEEEEAEEEGPENFDKHSEEEAEEEEDPESFAGHEEEEAEGEEAESFTNPNMFSSLEENFMNSSELFKSDDKEGFDDQKEENNGVVPANNLSGKQSEMYAPF